MINTTTNEISYRVQDTGRIEATYRGVTFTGSYYGFTRPPRWFFSTEQTVGGYTIGFEQPKAKGRGKTEHEKLFTEPAAVGTAKMLERIDERLDGIARAA